MDIGNIVVATTGTYQRPLAFAFVFAILALLIPLFTVYHFDRKRGKRNIALPLVLGLLLSFLSIILFGILVLW